MGTELYLKQISPNQLDQLHEHGLAMHLSNLYEQLSTDRDTWLLLDEHILGFMDYSQPEHPILFQAVMGGTAFVDSAGRDDYPRFFTPDEVKSIAQSLGNVSNEELQARFDATRDIFGSVCIGGTDEQAFARLRQRFQEAVDHYREAAQNGNAMLLLLY